MNRAPSALFSLEGFGSDRAAGFQQAYKPQRQSGTYVISSTTASTIAEYGNVER
jgi:hypothetical protein